MSTRENRSEKRYRALFDLSPFTIMTFSKSGIVTSCNKAMEELSGFSADDALGMHFLKLDYLGKEAVQYGVKYLPLILRGETLPPIEIPFTSRDGEDRWARAHIKLIHYPDGRHEIMAVVENITEEKRFRITLNRFRAFKESATDGFLILDKDLNILDANPTWVERTGFRGDVVGKNVHDVLNTTPEMEQRLELYREVIRTGKAVDFDHVLAPSGNGLVYHIKAFPVDAGVGLIVRDITERVKDEEEQHRYIEELLREQILLDQAKELDRLKAEFMNTTTHEIQTPLASIQGYSELIREILRSGDYEKASQYFEVIERNVSRLKVLSDDMLDMQRLEAGRVELVVEPVAVGALFDELRSTLHPLIGGNHEIVYDYPDGLVVICDRVRLLQVLDNLVSNAVKYSPGEKLVNVSAWSEDGSVVFSVADSGLGLTAKDIGKLFKPFPDILHDKVLHGTGLGLSICKGIVELHGGEIWVDSKGKGKGSVFSFSIPKN